MPVYRYDARAADTIVRRVALQSRIYLAIAFLAGLALVDSAFGLSKSLHLLPVFLAVLALLLWQQHRSSRRVRALIASTEFELTDTALTGRNSLITTVIPREEVTQLRHTKAGLFIRGRSLAQSLQPKPELENYADLVARLEAWLPPHVPRKQSAAFWPAVSPIFTIGNLGLLVLAFTVDNPALGAPLCLLEAAVLCGCVVWVWRQPGLAASLKRQMLIVLLPAASLLYRAWRLWSAII